MYTYPWKDHEYHDSPEFYFVMKESLILLNDSLPGFL